jgi:hypothetical protein
MSQFRQKINIPDTHTDRGALKDSTRAPSWRTPTRDGVISVIYLEPGTD